MNKELHPQLVKDLLETRLQTGRYINYPRVEVVPTSSSSVHFSTDAEDDTVDGRLTLHPGSQHVPTSVEVQLALQNIIDFYRVRRAAEAIGRNYGATLLFMHPQHAEERLRQPVAQALKNTKTRPFTPLPAESEDGEPQWYAQIPPRDNLEPSDSWKVEGLLDKDHVHKVLAKEITPLLTYSRKRPEHLDASSGYVTGSNPAELVGFSIKRRRAQLAGGIMHRVENRNVLAMHCFYLQDKLFLLPIISCLETLAAEIGYGAVEIHPGDSRTSAALNNAANHDLLSYAGENTWRMRARQIIKSAEITRSLREQYGFD